MQINNEEKAIEGVIERAVEGAIDAIKGIIKKKPRPDVSITNIKNADQSGGIAEDPVVVSDEDIPILIINI